MTELEDDCLVSELIDHFIETLNIPKFFECKDQVGALVFDENSTLQECKLKTGDTIYCFQQPIQPKSSRWEQVFIEQDMEISLLEQGITANCELGLIYVKNLDQPAIIQAIAPIDQITPTMVDEDTKIEIVNPKYTLRVQSKSKKSVYLLFIIHVLGYSCVGR